MYCNFVSYAVWGSLLFIIPIFIPYHVIEDEEYYENREKDKLAQLDFKNLDGD